MVNLLIVVIYPSFFGVNYHIPGSRLVAFPQARCLLRSPLASGWARLWVPEILSPSCDLGVFVDQAAEPVPPQNPTVAPGTDACVGPAGGVWWSARCGLRVL